MAKTASSFLQTLKRYVKKPWEITGPCADPEYRLAVPLATEYRLECPATVKAAAIVPSANPENVFDIKYFPRDQKRNRPPIKRTVLRKADVEKQMKETTFAASDFPPVYLVEAVEEDSMPEAEATVNELGLWSCGTVTKQVVFILGYIFV